MEKLTEEELIERVKQGEAISLADHKRLFRLPQKVRKQVLPMFCKQHILAYEDQMLIFNLPENEAVKLLLICIGFGGLTNKKSVKKIFQLSPEARKQVAPVYVKSYGFDDVVSKCFFNLPYEEMRGILTELSPDDLYYDGIEKDIRFFRLPKEQRDDLLSLYLPIFELSNEAQLKMIRLPKEERKILLPLYLAYWKLCDEAKDKFMKLSEEDRIELLRERVVKYPLCHRAQEEILQLSQ